MKGKMELLGAALGMSLADLNNVGKAEGMLGNGYIKVGRSKTSRKKGPGRVASHNHNRSGFKIFAHAEDERLCVRNPGGMVSKAFNEIRRQRRG